MPTPTRTAVRTLAAALAALALATARAAAGLTCSPPAVELHDAFAGRQLLVSDGGRDVTREAQYASSDPAVVRVDAAGYVTPAGDGTARVTVSRGTERVEVVV